MSNILGTVKNGQDAYLKSSKFVPSVYLRANLRGTDGFLRNVYEGSLPPMPVTFFGSGTLLYSKDGRYYKIF